ncbi:MAG: UxaA family hydrolase [Bacteroidota bacterium]
MAEKILKIHPADNVLVALSPLRQGEKINYNAQTITLLHDVPAKHKFLAKPVEAGDEICMYGVTVGRALHPLAAGEVITTQNTQHQAAPYSGRTSSLPWQAPDVTRWKGRTFMGYHRPDGQVGVANYWLVVPLVFCENRNVQIIRDAFEEALGFAAPNPYKKMVAQLADLYRQGKHVDVTTAEVTTALKPQPLFENIDGIRFLTHEGGCGGTRQDSDALCHLLAGYIHNPNVAGATILSLGCQHSQVSILINRLQELQGAHRKPLVMLEQQKEGTEQQLLTKAIHQTFLQLVAANKATRQPAPLSKLVVGLECGGSDGFSGISANPAVGHASDLLVTLGGTTILSEFPELCGVEQELINRTTDEPTAERFMHLMKAYAQAAEAVGSGFDMNPSPGNIKDGLITDAMKSAGAAKKGGTSPITDVLDYTEYVRKPGLNLLCTPGNDVESTTAMAGSGATLMLFTTGLGTPTGNPIAPVIKISSNHALAERMPDIIDYNCGSVITGEKTIAQAGEELLDLIIRVASGEYKTKAMQLQQYDFIPWKRGVSL